MIHRPTPAKTRKRECEEGITSSSVHGSGTGSSTMSSRKKPKLDKGSDDYQELRQRNNVAVKKSREKSREKAKNTVERVNRLKRENADLEQKVEILSKELSLLKDLFLAHAGTVANGECTIGDGLEKFKMLSDHEYSRGVKLDK